jgi:acyl-CoA synthetase (AMP-forming)/AMP-acid ligase II
VNLAFLPDYRANVDPEGPAVADRSQSLTNAQLLHRVRAASRHLRDLKIRPGDVVAIKLTNRVEFVVLLLAAWRLGAAITPINPSPTDVEVGRARVTPARACWSRRMAQPRTTTSPRSRSAICAKHSAGRICCQHPTRPRWHCSSTPAARPGVPKVRRWVEDDLVHADALRISRLSDIVL